jgi:hypothetical protein
VLRRHALPLVLLAVLAGLALYPACGRLFACGCEAPWSGADARCNVHAREGAHCPWCRHRGLGAAGLALTLGGQAAVYAGVRARSRSAAAGTFAGLLAFPPAATLAAFLTWLPSDYPHFLMPGLRHQLGLPGGPVSCHTPPRPGP